MAEFDRAIRDVETRLRARDLGHLLDGVRRIRAVREKSFHDSRTFVIGLNPADVRKPFAAFHARAYLLLHELGHHFAEAYLGRKGLRRLALLFGDYDSPSRRLPKPRACGANHLSRYAMTYPAEDAWYGAPAPEAMRPRRWNECQDVLPRRLGLDPVGCFSGVQAEVLSREQLGVRN